MLRKYWVLSISAVVASTLGACAEGTKLDIAPGIGGSAANVGSGGAMSAMGGNSTAAKGGALGTGGKASPLNSGGATTTKAGIGGGGSSSTYGSGGTTSNGTGSGGTLSSGGITGAVGGTAGAASTAPVVTAPTDGLGIKMADKQSVDGNNIKSSLVVVNQGTQAIDLSSVKIRYYFTMDSWTTPVFEIYYAGPDTGSANIKSEFFTVALPSADRYVEMSFAASAAQATPTLKAGAQLAIQTGLHDQSWKAPDTSNDYSFTGALVGFTDRMTVYVSGKLVWGVEPGTPPVSGAGGTSGGGAAGSASVGGAAGSISSGGTAGAGVVEPAAGGAGSSAGGSPSGGMAGVAGDAASAGSAGDPADFAGSAGTI